MTTDDSIASMLGEPNQREGAFAAGDSQNAVGSTWFWLAAFLPTIPLLAAYAIQTLFRVEFAFVPIAILLIAFLYVRRRDGEILRPGSFLQWVPIIVALGCVVVGALLAYGWFSAFAFVLVLFAFFSRSPDSIRPSLVPLAAPSVAILVLPFQFDASFAEWLHRKTAWLASIFMDYFEVPHAASGSVVQLLETEILVSDVSSGVLSIYAILFIALAIMAWKRVSPWLMPFYIAAALLTALVINAVRVVVSVLAVQTLELELVGGWLTPTMQTVGGLVAFLMLFSFHHLIVAFFHHIEPTQSAGSNPFIQGWNAFAFMDDNRSLEEASRTRSWERRRGEGSTVSGPIRMGLFGVVGLLTLVSIVQAFRAEPNATTQLVSANGLMVSPGDDFFVRPVDSQLVIEEHTFVEEEKSQGAMLRTDVWVGTFGGARFQMQVSQPLASWWEVERTFIGQGWELLDRDTLEIELSDSDDESKTAKPVSFARLRQTEPDALEGYLLYSAVNQSGDVVDPPTAASSLGQRIARRIGLGSNEGDETLAMFHLWLFSPEKLSASDLRDLKTDFAEFRRVLVETLRESNPSAAFSAGGQE